MLPHMIGKGWEGVDIADIRLFSNELHSNEPQFKW